MMVDGADFQMCALQGANRSNIGDIARICNAVECAFGAGTADIIN